MGILDTVAWIDIVVLTMVNLAIGVVIGFAYAAYDDNRKRKAAIKSNTEYFEHQYRDRHRKIRAINARNRFNKS